MKPSKLQLIVWKHYIIKEWKTKLLLVVEKEYKDWYEMKVLQSNGIKNKYIFLSKQFLNVTTVKEVTVKEVW